MTKEQLEELSLTELIHAIAALSLPAIAGFASRCADRVAGEDKAYINDARVSANLTCDYSALGGDYYIDLAARAAYSTSYFALHARQYILDYDIERDAQLADLRKTYMEL